MLRAHDHFGILRAEEAMRPTLPGRLPDTFPRSSCAFLQREEKRERDDRGFRGLGHLVQALINGAPEVKNGRPVSGRQKSESTQSSARCACPDFNAPTVVRRYNEFLKSGERVTIQTSRRAIYSVNFIVVDTLCFVHIVCGCPPLRKGQPTWTVMSLMTTTSRAAFYSFKDLKALGS